MKIVRFTQVVAKSGEPEPYALWSAPEKDRHFQAALHAHRVMSVHQANVGSQKDFGEVGFSEAEKGVLLIFPKSLKSFEGLRVVGVKYDLLKEPPPFEAPAERKKKPGPAPRAKAEPLRVFRPEEPKPTLKKEPVDAKKQLKSLQRKVGKALKKLEQGNTVAALQILRKATE